jgi:hypothetical protein
MKRYECREELAGLREALGPERWPIEQAIQSALKSTHRFYPGRVLIGQKNSLDVWVYLTTLNSGGSTGLHFACGSRTQLSLSWAWNSSHGTMRLKTPKRALRIQVRRGFSGLVLLSDLAMLDADHFEGALGSIKLRNRASMASLLATIRKNEEVDQNPELCHQKLNVYPNPKSDHEVKPEILDRPNIQRSREPLRFSHHHLLKNASSDRSHIIQVISTEQAVKEVEQQFKKWPLENEELAKTKLLLEKKILEHSRDKLQLS